eukprot:TRINITY_DN2273_c0_g1_i13.p2 TRINITY_DN2273_c0_g1~~TRINITY_DN2273_c0_g1_i13.p2  ORF type:complete len:252 (-),score=-0.66 TRINITY_DN2273_c0_g1_i13:54-809(-)
MRLIVRVFQTCVKLWVFFPLGFFSFLTLFIFPNPFFLFTLFVDRLYKYMMRNFIENFLKWNINMICREELHNGRKEGIVQVASGVRQFVLCNACIMFKTSKGDTQQYINYILYVYYLISSTRRYNIIGIHVWYKMVAISSFVGADYDIQLNNTKIQIDIRVGSYLELRICNLRQIIPKYKPILGQVVIQNQEFVICESIWYFRNYSVQKHDDKGSRHIYRKVLLGTYCQREIVWLQIFVVGCMILFITVQL